LGQQVKPSSPCIAVRRYFLFLMKQVLRPIGQCLTTAVVTSAMLESYALPLLATPTANPSHSQPTESSDSTIQTNVTSLIQPEAVALPETVSETISVPPALTEIRVEPIPTNAADAAPVAEPSANQNSTAGDSEQVPINHSPNAGSSEAATTPDSAPVETTQTPSPAGEAIANSAVLETARQELAEKLAAIVEQDKPEREAEFRQNLVASALHYAEVGEFDQARQVAQHPALPTEIQTELLTKIDEIEVAQQPQPEAEESVAIAENPAAPSSYPTAGYSNISARTLPPGLAGYQGDRCLAPVAPSAGNSGEIAVNLSGIQLAATPATLTPDQQLASLLTISNAANETINLIQTSKPEKVQLGQIPQEPITVSEANKLTQGMESEAAAFEELGQRQPSADRWGEVKLNHVVGSTLDNLLNKVGITTVPAVFNSLFLGQTYPTVSEFEQTQQPVSPGVSSAETATGDLEAQTGDRNSEISSALPDITLPRLTVTDPALAIATGLPSPLEEIDKGFGKANAIAPLRQSLNWQKAEAENPFAVLVQSTGSINCAIAPGRFTGYSVTTALSQQFSRIGMAFPLPIPAALTSAFGWRIHPIFGDRRFHAGIDLGAPQGTPVIAAVSGRVAVADYMGGYGLTVVLENQNVALRNLYAHLSGIAVQPGTWVEQGSVIGWVGSTGNSTGPHLHFEAQQLTANGWVAVDPLANGAMSVARAQP
jgi:murein DD-endopeptidase MepM/ murein hydrolase activator NlpD